MSGEPDSPDEKDKEALCIRETEGKRLRRDRSMRIRYEMTNRDG